MGLQSSKIGAILGMIGSTIFLIVGLFGLTMARRMYHPDPNFPIILPYITVLLTIALSACGFVGSILVFRDFPMGYIILFVAGIVGIVGTFVTTSAYDDGYGYVYYTYLVNTAMYIDLVPMVVGAVLGFALAEKKERKL
ncbi:MAG: hypothetical protein HWN80_19840 [Candidatus Lokiarchaeota archaeon]|nr:hypothetical protein [Candidatus Lokiarchaeota archaeon]